MQGLRAAVIGYASLAALLLGGDAAAQAARVLDCESNFPATASAAGLADRFGAANVVNAEISVGEGLYEKGTVLFADSADDKVEIIWKDAEGLRLPRVVRIQGESSNWSTRSGLSLGDDLRTVERFNRKPFRLAGFSWDYAGTVLSWSGGALEGAAGAACVVRVRLAPDESADNVQWRRQVKGDRAFSSAHPAMKALNPRIYEIWLEY